jgi:hypothetical protein
VRGAHLGAVEGAIADAAQNRQQLVLHASVLFYCGALAFQRDGDVAIWSETERADWSTFRLTNLTATWSSVGLSSA